MVAKSIYSADQESLLKVMGRIRTDAGLPQQVHARKVAVSQSTVSDILRGQRRLDMIEWISFCKVSSSSRVEGIGAVKRLFVDTACIKLLSQLQCRAGRPWSITPPFNGGVILIPDGRRPPLHNNPCSACYCSFPCFR
jgi:hypothetical protein